MNESPLGQWYPIDLLGWDYTEPAACAERLLSNLFSRIGKRLDPEWETFGGRGFGLALADAFDQPTLAVPPWTVVPADDVQRMTEERLATVSATAVVLEHFTHRTDWHDADTGFRSHVLSAARAADVQGYLHHSPPGFWLVQKYVAGREISIDVGYSRRRNRNVVRFLPDDAAAPMTFATNGDALQRLPRHWLAPHCGAVAIAVSCGLARLGVSFGTRLKAIVHPDAPDVWKIVELRPAPLHVRKSASRF